MRNPPEPSLPPTATLKPSTCAPADFPGRWRQREILRFRVGADLFAGGDRDVEFARQIGEGFVADEDLIEFTHHR